MTTLGKRISTYRKRHEYTQESLAEKLNVSAQAVSKWENDLSIPDLPLLIELSNIFNITLDQLVKSEQEPSNVQFIPVNQRKPMNQMVLSIKVESEGDKITINLPLVVIEACIKAGKPFISDTKGKDIMGSIDFDMIFTMIEQGAIGTLLEVTTNDGDHIVICVE